MKNYTRKKTNGFGDTCYYNDKDQYHRNDGPAAEYANGSKAWWVNGGLHRLDGPAVEYSDGSKHWYVNGKRHRLDGPAIEWGDGDKEWFINGQRMAEEEFSKHPLVIECNLGKIMGEVLDEQLCEKRD